MALQSGKLIFSEVLTTISGLNMLDFYLGTVEKRAISVHTREIFFLFQSKLMA